MTDGDSLDGYVDIREIHPDWREEVCWYCGRIERVRRQWRVCHGCFMGQQKRDEEHRDSDHVVNGYTDYGRLWYGEVDDRDEYQELHEESTKEIRERMDRRHMHEREVRI